MSQKNKILKCPECDTVCQLGRINSHDSFNLLSIEGAGDYLNIGLHFSTSQGGFGHCGSFKAGRNKLLKIISQVDWCS